MPQVGCISTDQIYMDENETLLKKAVEAMIVLSEFTALLHRAAGEKRAVSPGGLTVLAGGEPSPNGDAGSVNGDHLVLISKEDSTNRG
jgi:hypothetical protein